MNLTPTTPRMLLILAGLFLLPGCYVRQAYYASPFNGDSPGYHAEPMIRDTSRSAIYAGLTYYSGAANTQHTDRYYACRLDAYRSHHGKILQGYYGLDFTLGNFNTGSWDTSWRYAPVNSKLLNERAGNHGYGGVGIAGGLNLVAHSFRTEWRYLGVEGSYHREFGDYLSWRRQLPDSLATLVVRNPDYYTLGLSSEWVHGTYNGDFGFKMGFGWSVGKGYQNSGIHDNSGAGPLAYHYYIFTSHYTFDRYTGFLQFQQSTKAYSVQFGLHVRLTR